MSSVYISLEEVEIKKWYILDFFFTILLWLHINIKMEDV